MERVGHSSTHSTHAPSTADRQLIKGEQATGAHRGCSVAHAFHDSNLPSRLHAHLRRGGRHSLIDRRKIFMDAAVIIIYATAVAASSAAVLSAVYDRFRKAAATSTAFVAGLIPWLFLLVWHGQIPSSTALSVISLFSSGPLFLVAFFLYGFGRRTSHQAKSARASLFGMFAGGAFSIVLCDLLSRMP